MAFHHPGHRGVEGIAGIDEAGRGPLAGPVLCAAVILDEARPIAGLADSKTLSVKQRAVLAGRIEAYAVAWALGVPRSPRSMLSIF